MWVPSLSHSCVTSLTCWPLCYYCSRPDAMISLWEDPEMHPLLAGGAD